jgi:hypothetical protein
MSSAVVLFSDQNVAFSHWGLYLVMASYRNQLISSLLVNSEMKSNIGEVS